VYESEVGHQDRWGLRVRAFALARAWRFEEIVIDGHEARISSTMMRIVNRRQAQGRVV
jgi:hypothetical protein